MNSQKQAKADEFFFVVDEHDHPLAPLPRKAVHGQGIWHRTAHVWLVNDANQVLCQQRSLHKELNAGLWEPFFGGHLAPDESYETGAPRELQEELALDLPAEAFRLWKVYQFRDPAGYNNEFQGVFVVHWNGETTDVRFADGEVAQVAWHNLADVAIHSRPGQRGWTYIGYEPALLADLQAHVL